MHFSLQAKGPIPVNSWQTLGKFYCAYANGTSPGKYLHSSASLQTCASSVRSNQRLAQWSRAQNSDVFVAARAKEYGAKAAILSAVAFAPIDAIVGTGTYEAGKVQLVSLKDLRGHIRQIIGSPTETGLAGLTLGGLFVPPIAIGALVGLVVGFNVAVFDLFRQGDATGHYRFNVNIIKDCSGAGAIAGASHLIYFQMHSLVGLAQPIGLIRAATGLAKVTLAATLYGLGFGVGILVALAEQKLMGSFLWRQPTAANRSFNGSVEPLALAEEPTWTAPGGLHVPSRMLSGAALPPPYA